jgi:hypothetical protein
MADENGMTPWPSLLPPAEHYSTLPLWLGSRANCKPPLR